MGTRLRALEELTLSLRAGSMRMKDCRVPILAVPRQAQAGLTVLPIRSAMEVSPFLRAPPATDGHAPV